MMMTTMMTMMMMMVMMMMMLMMTMMVKMMMYREEWRISPWKLQQARYNHGTLTVPGDMFPQCS